MRRRGVRAGHRAAALGPLQQLAGIDAQDALAIAIEAEQPLALAEAQRLDEAGEAVLPLVEALVAGAEHGLGLAQVERPARHGARLQEHALHRPVAVGLQRRIGDRGRRAALTGLGAALAGAGAPPAIAVAAVTVAPVASVAAASRVPSRPSRRPRLGRRHAVRGGVGGGVELVEVRLGRQQRRRQDRRAGCPARSAPRGATPPAPAAGSDAADSVTRSGIGSGAAAMAAAGSGSRAAGAPSVPSRSST